MDDQKKLKEKNDDKILELKEQNEILDKKLDEEKEAYERLVSRSGEWQRENKRLHRLRRNLGLPMVCNL